MSFTKKLQANYETYCNKTSRLSNNFLHYPRTISIETQVKCNAQCSFCPYPTSPRSGQEMSTQLFHKIIDDLSKIPPTHKFSITLARINEPLLDKRLKKFSQLIAQKLPSASQSFWTNGTMLQPGNFEWMSSFPSASLTISLNSIDNKEHKKLMGFGVEKVFNNLDYLHQFIIEKKFSLSVNLSAPFQGIKKTTEIENFCSSRWPLFKLGIRPFFIWTGTSSKGEKEKKEYSSNATQLNHFPCAQWFDLHFLANGYMTKCCIDESGYSTDNYDASKMNALDIYSLSQALRETLPPRENVSGCNNCHHLG